MIHCSLRTVVVSPADAFRVDGGLRAQVACAAVSAEPQHIRQTAPELVIENHAQHLKELARHRSLGLSIEPFCLPAGQALKRKANVLEITPVHLWCNRLIGDAGLSKEPRVAWTEWNPLKPEAKLLESGLLGPVALEVFVQSPK